MINIQLKNNNAKWSRGYVITTIPGGNSVAGRPDLAGLYHQHNRLFWRAGPV